MLSSTQPTTAVTAACDAVLMAAPHVPPQAVLVDTIPHSESAVHALDPATAAATSLVTLSAMASQVAGSQSAPVQGVKCPAGHFGGDSLAYTHCPSTQPGLAAAQSGLENPQACA